MSARAALPDIVRLVALFGIAAVNVQFFAHPSELGFVSAAQQTPPDQAATWLVAGLATFKTYGLFAFMFGVGLAYQMGSAARSDAPMWDSYRRRLLGLTALGLFHAAFLYFGDILVVYALMGLLLFRWRDVPPPLLVRRAYWLIGAQVVFGALVLGLLLALPTDPETAALEATLMTSGGFWDIAANRFVFFLIAFVPLVLMQGLAALGWFCLGLAAAKSGMIACPDHPLWSRARRVLLPIGVTLSLGAAAIAHWGDPVLGNPLVLAFAPIATLGYLGLLAYIAQRADALPAGLLRAGRASLSIYLGQSIVLSLIFMPYGLGLWEQVGPATSVFIALGVTLGLVLALSGWLRVARLGPFEWVLRRITYRQPALT
ncbi:MAG: DUF418 domain-containing protein [Pseudomonadota bacterium]